MDALIGQIYRAAGDERLWNGVVEQVRRRFSSGACECVLYQGAEAVSGFTTAVTRDIVDCYIDDRHWETNERVGRYLSGSPLTGFVTADSYYTPEMLATDACARLLASRGLHQQVLTMLHLGGDRMAAFTVERTLDDPEFNAADLSGLNRLRSALQGACELNAQLTTERSQSTVALLQHMAEPAAVVGASGKLLACNRAFEAALPDWGEVDGRERLQARDLATSRWLSDALFALVNGTESALIRVRASETGPWRLRLLPLLGAASDWFGGGQVVLLLEGDPPSALRQPSWQALQAHFGLATSEARLACLLASGDDLRSAGAKLNLTYATARTYMDRVFQKTQTHRQTDLVRLVLTLT